jgi:hypothetical protein
LLRYLPEAVFIHEEGFVARAVRVQGNQVDAEVNKTILLEELEAHLVQWPTSRRAGIPLPSTTTEEEFLLREPATVDWDVWPLLYACTNGPCQRARQFFEARRAVQAADPDRGLVCRACGAKLQQLRYYLAHACGRQQPLYMPRCKNCGEYDNIYLEDTGSFETASWRCRACGNAYVQGTRFTPCNCGDYKRAGRNVAFMRAFPVRDQRTWYPHTMSLINLRSNTYNQLQRHPERAQVAIASYLGDQREVRIALEEADLAGRGADQQRMAPAEWEAREAQYRAMGLEDEDIAAIKARRGPRESGIAAIGGLSPELVAVGEQRRMLERAMLSDPSVATDRRNLSQALEEEESLGRAGVAAGLQAAIDYASRLGISDLSVTLEFPILLATYGYTRTRRQPGQSHLKGFARQNAYGGKTPLFVAASNTEALHVELAASAVLDFLIANGDYEGPVPASEREARSTILELFAIEHPCAAIVKTLTHSLAHVMLRALDDGQTGFGESSLAEWIVPEALSFAIYVASYQAYTLGAFWTLLHTRTESWLERTVASVWRCDNDPLCHHRYPSACERCMFLTFGCRDFNGDLSRRILMDFWRHRGVPATML